MIELKQVYAGRARQVFDLCGKLQPQLYEVLDFQERALPEELTTTVLKAWQRRPFVSTTPLQLQVEGTSRDTPLYDVFLWVYVTNGFIYPTLEAARFEAPANRWPVQ